MNEIANKQQHKLICSVGLSQLMGLHFFNIVLEFITLGIYYFWGKTEFRKTIINSCELDNNRFEYTGTGNELFIGFLIMMPILVLVYIIYFVVLSLGDPIIESICTFFLIFMYMIFIGYAQYSATRYILSRTTYMGIKGGLAGSAFNFAWKYFLYNILNLMTLFLASPFITLYLNGLIKNNMYFGNEKFKFTVRINKELFNKNLFSVVTLMLMIFSFFLAPITILILWPLYLVFSYQYRAEMYRNMASNTRIMNLRFRSAATAGSLFTLNLGNLMITIFTLGLFKPWVILRRIRYFCNNLDIIGEIDLEKIKQSQLNTPEFGEGLADSMDVGTGFGY